MDKTQSLYEIYSEAKRIRADFGFDGAANAYRVLAEAAKIYPRYLKGETLHG